jgi:hypothetical protein
MGPFDTVLSQVLGKFWGSLEALVTSRVSPVGGWDVGLVTWTKRNPYVEPDVYLAVEPHALKRSQYLYPAIQQVKSKGPGLALILGVAWARQLRRHARELQVPEVRELRKALQPRYARGDGWWLGYRDDRQLSDLRTLQSLLCEDNQQGDSPQSWKQKLGDELAAFVRDDPYRELLRRANDALWRRRP